MATVSSAGAADIVIAGASARAAAFSALRAGLRPIACDLFGDADLRAVCPTVRLSRRGYPGDLTTVLARLPPLPLVYTGGLENRPDVVSAIAARQRVIGNGADVLRRCRDPLALRRALAAAGLDTLEALAPGEPIPFTGRWLVKPLSGSGGVGIRPARATDRVVPQDCYVQEHAAGTPAAAVFVASSAGVRLLGVTRQLIGEAHLHAPPFAYSGSIGPLRVRGRDERWIEAAGRAAATEFALLGLFGLDLVLADLRPLVVEINPRFPASVEVLESASGFSALALHIDACEKTGTASTVDGEARPAGPRTLHGKAVVYAPWNARVRPAVAALALRGPTQPFDVADVPAPGALLRAGTPFLTVFARAASTGGCRRALAARATEALSLLEPRCTPRGGGGPSPASAATRGLPLLGA